MLTHKEKLLGRPYVGGGGAYINSLVTNHKMEFRVLTFRTYYKTLKFKI